MIETIIMIKIIIQITTTVTYIIYVIYMLYICYICITYSNEYLWIIELSQSAKEVI